MTISREAARRRLWTALVLAWAVAVVGLGYLAYRHGNSTDREQTGIRAALSTVDAALADVAAVAAAPEVVRILGSPAGQRSDCRITPLRAGVRYRRALDLYLPPAGSRPALVRIAAGLPKRYGATVTGGEDAPELEADAGNFVTVRGEVRTPGRVRILADTGCRADDGPVGELRPIPEPAGRAPIQALLDALRVGGGTGSTHRVHCPDRTDLTTVEVRAGMPADGVVAVTRALPPDAMRFTAELDDPAAYVYRMGDAVIAVRVDGDALVVDATTGC